MKYKKNRRKERSQGKTDEKQRINVKEMKNEGMKQWSIEE